MEGVHATSHMEKQGDKFKLIWTRAETRAKTCESETTTRCDKTKLDIVRPGRYNNYFVFGMVTIVAAVHVHQWLS